MNDEFQLPTQAIADLDDIWWFIAKDNREAANRVEITKMTKGIACSWTKVAIQNTLQSSKRNHHSTALR